MKLFKQLFAIVLVAVMAPVYGHTGLGSSVPAEGAILTESPSDVTLNFTGDVRLTGFELIDEMTGEIVDTGFRASADPAATFALPVPQLSSGHYRVNWTLLGADGHTMTGGFSFMVHGQDMPMSGSGMPMQGGDMPMQGGSMPMHEGHMPMSGTGMPMQGGSMPMQGGTMPMNDDAIPDAEAPSAHDAH